MASSCVQTEKECWQRLLNGEREALAFFYHTYADRLLKYGLTITPNRELVRDAVQELYVQIWNRRNTLSPAEFPKYYLMISLRRMIISDLKREQRISAQFPQETAITYKAEEDASNKDDSLRLLNLYIGALPARQKEILFLRFYEKLDYQKISEITGLEHQVLRNTLYRAIKTLREKLSAILLLLLLIS
jgi:RNA polymerase sigma factor (sigma-70 family)